MIKFRFNFNFYSNFYSIFNSNFIQFCVTGFILLYNFISCVYINSTYTHNYRKLFCCVVVAFCATAMPLVFPI